MTTTIIFNFDIQYKVQCLPSLVLCLWENSEKLFRCRLRVGYCEAGNALRLKSSLSAAIQSASGEGVCSMSTKNDRKTLH